MEGVPGTESFTYNLDATKRPILNMMVEEAKRSILQAIRDDRFKSGVE